MVNLADGETNTMKNSCVNSTNDPKYQRKVKHVQNHIVNKQQITKYLMCFVNKKTMSYQLVGNKDVLLTSVIK